MVGKRSSIVVSDTMASFEVQYAFQCIICRKVNANVVVVDAANEYSARELSLASTICGRCKRRISNHQTFTIRVRESS